MELQVNIVVRTKLAGWCVRWVSQKGVRNERADLPTGNSRTDGSNDHCHDLSDLKNDAVGIAVPTASFLA